MSKVKYADVNVIQLENVRFNRTHYTGAGGLYCGADVDLESVGPLQQFFQTALLTHQGRLSSFMPVNPEHGLHCTIVYSKGTSPQPPDQVREYAKTLQKDFGDGYEATVEEFEYWEDKKKPGKGYLVAKLKFPEAGRLSKQVQKDLGVEHTFADDYQAHMTLCDGRDANAYAPYVPLLNERLRALGPVNIRFNAVGIRDIQ